MTGYETNIKNKLIPGAQDKTRLNSLLLEMGVHTEILNWYEDEDTDYSNLPIDDQTKITLTDMNAIREKFLEKEDFEAMKKITVDLKKVVSIGRTIFGLQSELEFEIAKQNFQRAIELKEEIRKWAVERDKFDARWETSRYEEMIRLGKPDNDDYFNMSNNGTSGIGIDEQAEFMNQSERSRVSSFLNRPLEVGCMREGLAKMKPA